MKWIGLTGNIASGKSTVANLLKQLGQPVVDADQIVHDLLKYGQKGYTEVVNAFGLNYLNEKNEIDRLKLGKAVFSDETLLKKLENLLHPLVQNEVLNVKEKLKLQNNKLAFYDVPLLFEKKLNAQFDKIVLVYVDKDLQISRLKSRNPEWSEKHILNRIETQLSYGFKIKHSDFCLDNNSTVNDLSLQVKRLVSRLSVT